MALLFSYGFAAAGELPLPDQHEFPAFLSSGNGFTDHRSSQNLFQLDREVPWGLPRAPLSTTIHLRICAIRVEFQPDSNPRSTGPGIFDLTPSEHSPTPFDRTPHNKYYFDSQMQALYNYYLAVSDSQLTLEWDIYPEEPEAAYRLPDSMAYYGPSGWFGNNMLYRLSGFFKDGWNLAFDQDSIDFRDYDVFLLFHAGADWQNDIGSYYEEWDPETYVPSPDDLPTAFITFSQPVINGIISEGLIIPEFASQDGQYIALNGLLTHEFGHQLGLVDLYSTYNFITQVGYFSLMDNGNLIGVWLPFEEETLAVFGAIPAYPSAWERAYLGWETITEYQCQQQTFSLTTGNLFNTPEDNTIMKIPVNEYEYFLIENRQYNPGGSDVYLKQDSLTGVFLGLIDEADKFTSKYDYLLPGSGLLIWHVDEAVAYMDYVGNGQTNFANNTLQWDWERLFIDLEEAEGPQDLGVVITYGDSLDFYHEDNISEFSPYTIPNTNSNLGGFTGLTISNISAPGVIMSFDISSPNCNPASHRITGWPLEKPIVLADFNDDGQDEIFTVMSNFVLGWTGDGDKLIQNADTLGIIGFSGDTALYPLPTFYYRNNTEFTIPSLGDLDGDGTLEVAAGADDSFLYCWEVQDLDSSGRADLLLGFPLRLQGRIYLPPVIANFDNSTSEPEIFVGTSNGKWYIISAEATIIDNGDIRGEILGVIPRPDNSFYILAQQWKGKLFKYSLGDSLLWSIDLDHGFLSTLIGGDINRDGNLELVTVSEEGYLYVFDQEGQNFGNFPVFFEEVYNLSDPLFSDINGDSDLEIIFSAGNKLHAFYLSGSTVENFPRSFDSTLIASPITADLDADGDLEIIVGGSNSNLYAFHHDGLPVDGFPLASEGIWAAAAWGKLGEGASNQVVAGSVQGILMVWDFPQSDAPNWPMWGFSSEHNHTFDLTLPDNPPADNSHDLITSFYNHPNPAQNDTYIRYYLNRQAELTLRIFDQTGNLILNKILNGLESEYNSYRWDSTGIPSGVYICQLEAKNNDKTEIHFCKIALIK
ncbi:T9SS type A sorting domain-containing protein [bacterium]|nr:T9SS type A sorting domain-containing protein [bacterium]